MLKDRINHILFENAFLSAFRSAGDASDSVADQALDAAQSAIKICNPDGAGANGTMRTIRSKLYKKFTGRLMHRLIEQEAKE